MSQKKWGFFPFDAMDYKAAQSYLDKKSAQGWILDKISLKWFARFVPAEGRYHCVDIDTPHIFEDDFDGTYVQFCEDAGWELVSTVRNMLIFRSQPDQHPAPLQTDEGMEAERFWKKYMRRNLLTQLILLAILIPLCIFLFSQSSSAPALSRLFCYNSRLLQLPMLLFILIGGAWSCVRMIMVYLRFRRSGKPPKQTHLAPWIYGLLSCFMLVLIAAWWVFDIAETFSLGETVDVAQDPFDNETSATPELCQSYPVITAADLGLEYSDDSRYLDGRRSILVNSLDYSEITDGEEGATHILTTMRYECVNETVAKWMFSARRNETTHGVDFTWGELEWSEVTSDYGCDQICTARDNSYLLLQEGDTVALVGATEFDLTQPEQLETLWERLDLDT